MLARSSRLFRIVVHVNLWNRDLHWRRWVLVTRFFLGYMTKVVDVSLVKFIEWLAAINDEEGEEEEEEEEEKEETKGVTVQCLLAPSHPSALTKR